MAEDTSFRKMLEDREASKERGRPSGFTKMQNSVVWGVKPNIMGEGKDYGPITADDITYHKDEGSVKKEGGIEEVKDAKKVPETSGLSENKMKTTAETKPLDPMKGIVDRTKLTYSQKAEGEFPSFEDLMSPYGIKKKAGRQAGRVYHQARIKDGEEVQPALMVNTYKPEKQDNKNPDMQVAINNAKKMKDAELKDDQDDLHTMFWDQEKRIADREETPSIIEYFNSRPPMWDRRLKEKISANKPGAQRDVYVERHGMSPLRVKEDVLKNLEDEVKRKSGEAMPDWFYSEYLGKYLDDIKDGKMTYDVAFDTAMDDLWNDSRDIDDTEEESTEGSPEAKEAFDNMMGDPVGEIDGMMTNAGLSPSKKSAEIPSFKEVMFRKTDGKKSEGDDEYEWVIGNPPTRTEWLPGHPSGVQVPNYVRRKKEKKDLKKSADTESFEKMPSIYFDTDGEIQDIMQGKDEASRTKRHQLVYPNGVKIADAVELEGKSPSQVGLPKELGKIAGKGNIWYSPGDPHRLDIYTRKDKAIPIVQDGHPNFDNAVGRGADWDGLREEANNISQAISDAKGAAIGGFITDLLRAVTDGKYHPEGEEGKIKDVIEQHNKESVEQSEKSPIESDYAEDVAKPQTRPGYMDSLAGKIEPNQRTMEIMDMLKQGKISYAEATKLLAEESKAQKKGQKKGKKNA